MEMGDTGMTRREHLEKLVEGGAASPDELHGPSMPESVAHVWKWFLELRIGLQGGITYAEIKAWQEMTGTLIRPFEVDLIKQIDLAYLEIQQDHARRRTTSNRG